ncbi:MAG TPA: LysR family transcriptional regulator [Tissierellaceae bacterium]
MNLEYLKSFYVTVKLNSISKAAKHLHLTQPGLSMQIQNLEKDLGAELLKRSNKGVELTEAGRIVFEYADTILSMKENIERDIKSLQHKRKELLLGACKAIGEYALPCSIYIFKHENNDVDINLNINNTEGVIKELLDRTINIGIIHGETETKNVKTELIATDPLLLVTSLPIMKDKITFDEFKKLPLIFREKGSGTYKTIQNALMKHDINIEDLNIIYELNSMEAIKTSVLSGKGIAFIQELSIKRHLKDGDLKVIQVEGLEVYSKFYIAYRENYELNDYENQFIQFIKSSKRGFC